MAEATSPTTGRRYGVARVCQIWDQPRSSFYAARQPQAGAVAPASASARRGPKPSVGDETLLAAIRADLERSPWTGEGHRRVWARLRAIDGVRVSRKRLLRLMRGACPAVAPSRSHALRRAARSADRHRGAECDVGDRRDPNRHRPGRQGLAVRRRRALERRAARLACRQARYRFEALQAVGMAVRNQFGRVDAGAAAAWRCAMITAATSCRTLSRTNPLLGHRAKLCFVE